MNDLNEIYIHSENPSPVSDWEQNGIDSTTGGNSVNTKRIRTIASGLPKDIDSIKANTGYVFVAHGWNSNNQYIGPWNGEAFVFNNSKLLNELELSPLYSAGAAKIRLVMIYGSSDITPSDGVNIVYVTNTNKLDNIASESDILRGDVDSIINILGFYENLADPSNLELNKVWNSVNSTYSASGYCRQEVIVEPLTKYTISKYTSSFCWFTNDNVENLGKITTNPFETPEGCTRIRLGTNGSDNFVVLKGEHQIPVVYANYPYGETYSALDNIDRVNDRITETIEAIQKADYVSLSLLSTLGAIGDSYTSGGIYGVEGADSGAHYDISWPQILAKKCGFEAVNYSKSGIDVSAWLSDTSIGLPKLTTDVQKQLYVITLGINAEKKISDPSVSADTGTISDINISDPSLNGDTFYGHYGRMVSGIINYAPNAKIILVKPVITSSAKLTAIADIGELFGLPVISMSDDWYYKTSFYTDNLSTSHPIALTYSGMALAYERQIKQCMVDNATYFKNLV